MKNAFKRIAAVLLSLLVIAGCTFFINLRLNQNVYVSDYSYSSSAVPKAFDGFKIAVISDIHNSKYADKFIEALDKVNADIIIFSGDMIQQPTTQLDNVLKIVKSQKDKCRIYAVFGNHEAQNGNTAKKKIINQLSQNGVSVLMNKVVNIERDGSKIRLIGIEDSNKEHIDDAALDKIRSTALSLADDEFFNILIYHRANIYPQIKDLPVDLIISGHLHGGVARLPFIGGIVGESGKSFFPKYTSGIYKEGKNSAEMIVSRGCDYNPSKMRIFNPPEIPVITLKSED